MNIFKPGARRPQRVPGFLKLILFFFLFFKIDPVRIDRRYACVCPRPRLLITSDVMWRDMDLIRLVKQVLQLL